MLFIHIKYKFYMYTQCVEKQRHNSDDKGPYWQGFGLPSGHIQM